MATTWKTIDQGNCTTMNHMFQRYLRKILHNHQLTYEELNTVINEIEAILNSRPITPMSNDPKDLQPLTPGHFLIGAPVTSINDTTFVNHSLQTTFYTLTAFISIISLYLRTSNANSIDKFDWVVCMFTHFTAV